MDFRNPARVSRDADLAVDQARFAWTRVESDVLCRSTLRRCVVDYSIARLDRRYRLSLPALVGGRRRVPGTWLRPVAQSPGNTPDNSRVAGFRRRRDDCRARRCPWRPKYRQEQITR